VYLNWALGLRDAGCRVVWLELTSPGRPRGRTAERVRILRRRLAHFGLGDDLAVASDCEETLPSDATPGCLDLADASDADLLLDMAYGPPEVVARFRRTALLDIDPGLCQLWASRGQLHLAPHDVYFSIGETVGRPGARFPDAGLSWEHTPPCVHLDSWPVTAAPASAPFTTVSNWIMYDYWVEEENGGYPNDKRTGFLPFLDLPNATSTPLELALSLGGAEEERESLEKRGWRVREAHEAVATPDDYRRYVQRSAGEWSAAKPSCVKLQNAWVSDRTLCYLASGKPAIVQHTGPSAILPDAAGLFRFTTLEQAAQHLDSVRMNYGRQCRLARALAEEHFDARLVVPRLVSRALG
jgi:hypothetical protein